jgi:hypothetical protein
MRVVPYLCSYFFDLYFLLHLGESPIINLSHPQLWTIVKCEMSPPDILCLVLMLRIGIVLDVLRTGTRRSEARVR